jgi:hypothetical protein
MTMTMTMTMTIINECEMKMNRLFERETSGKIKGVSKSNRGLFYR